MKILYFLSLSLDLEGLQGQFTVLSKLPPSTRSSLFQQISLLLQDSAAIGVLEDAVSDKGNLTSDLVCFYNKCHLVVILNKTYTVLNKCIRPTPNARFVPQLPSTVLVVTNIIMIIFYVSVMVNPHQYV